MAVHPNKCRALSLAQQNIFYPITADLKIGNEIIKDISDGDPFKFLGTCFEHEGKA